MTSRRTITKQKDKTQYLIVRSNKGNLDVKDYISDDLLIFLSTTPYRKTVFYSRSDTSIQQFYSVDVSKVTFDLYGYVKLLLTWNEMEPGVKLFPFYVNYHEVCWQEMLGRRQDSKGIL